MKVYFVAGEVLEELTDNDLGIFHINHLNQPYYSVRLGLTKLGPQKVFFREVRLLVSAPTAVITASPNPSKEQRSPPASSPTQAVPFKISNS